MKSAYVICILLSITISYLTLANADGVTPIQNGTQTSNVTYKVETTAVPLSTNSTPSSTPSSTPATTISSTTPNATTPTKHTTAVPTKPPTTSPTTTSKPTSTVPTTVKTSTVTSTVVSSTEATTTAVPSSSKDRHFDGLSFFGGIILATCLMAIAVFSWKFYRQCNQENYRTL